MIKFFRRIRRTLIDQNQMGKYFKYAIGEILLVVIGILIALQINNWNEDRKTNNVRNNYLNQVVIDLEADKAYYTKVINSLEKNLVKYEGYKSLYDTPDLEMLEVLYYVKENFTNFTLRIEINTSTIKTMINTGTINLIENPLRDELSKYVGRQTRSVNIYEGNADASQLIGVQLMSKGYYPQMLERLAKQPKLARALGIDDNLPKALLELDAYLDLVEFNEVNVIKAFKELKAVADELIVQINNEIQ
ncbi:Beta-lactamase [Croceitalea dokdonensis DOKDO 023]|uniref:Beta-lactamase n=1 Tax=Croceitalea dokdonensis DOKDO 023 TaxID=1300341 RepID=A0A0P7AW88_9FLAO|nr:DUF6090 family protein [Croceitalea dokdonensis]KPM32941.1 Beta-lactamase [Croceitalea dokdonensis DOKDO 023]